MIFEIILTGIFSFMIPKLDTLFYFIDVAAEKNAKNLLASLEGFDTSKLKHAETKEKNPLPDKDGKSNFT